MGRHGRGHREDRRGQSSGGDARDGAGGGREGQSRGQRGRQRAVGKLLDRRTDVQRGVSRVGDVRRGLDGHARGERVGARHGLHLHRVHVARSSSGTEGEAVRLEGPGVEVAVERLVLAGGVPGAGHGYHVHERTGGARRAGQRERARRGRRVGVGPHAHAVDVRTRSAQLVGHRSGENRGASRVVVLLVPVENVGGVEARRRGDGHVVGVHVALGVLGDGRGGSDQRQERVELGSVVAGGGEVQFHGKHVVRGGELASGANHGVVLVVRESTVGGSGRRDFAVKHVVAEDLHAVHVGDDAELVIHVHLVSRHVRNAREGLAEVLRALKRGKSRTERHGLPVRVGEVRGVPVRVNARRRRGHLPFHVLHNRVIQRERVLLLALLHQKRLQHHVAVQTGHADPGTTIPRIAVRIDDLEGVLVVRRGSQTVLIGTLFVVRERGARLQYGLSIQNLVRFLGTIACTLLRHRHVHLAILTGQGAQSSGNYA